MQAVVRCLLKSRRLSAIVTCVTTSGLNHLKAIVLSRLREGHLFLKASKFIVQVLTDVLQR